MGSIGHGRCYEKFGLIDLCPYHSAACGAEKGLKNIPNVCQAACNVYLVLRFRYTCDVRLGVKMGVHDNTASYSVVKVFLRDVGEQTSSPASRCPWSR